MSGDGPKRSRFRREKLDAAEIARRTALGHVGFTATTGSHDAAGPEDVDPLVGTVVLDRYLIAEELGAGAMGSVYRGRYQKLERDVAIKVMHAQHLDEPVLIERFRREAKLAARLNHTNVVTVLDVGQTDDGSHVMVMDFAQGESLTTLLARPGPLPRERIITLVTQLLLGLDHAHDMGLVHRDLKPDNIIVESGDHPRIVDFGIAILRDPDERAEGGRLTASGMIIGTPAYMAPEQAKGEAFDQRADLYSLGVILYEMLAGVGPFTGTPMEIAIANIHRDPPPFATRVPGVAVDPLLDAFMRKLMCRDLSRRVASARDAIALLELLEHDREAAALALGIMDVARALALITLPNPP